MRVVCIRECVNVSLDLHINTFSLSPCSKAKNVPATVNKCKNVVKRPKYVRKMYGLFCNQSEYWQDIVFVCVFTLSVDKGVLNCSAATLLALILGLGCEELSDWSDWSDLSDRSDLSDLADGEA